MPPTHTHTHTHTHTPPERPVSEQGACMAPAVTVALWGGCLLGTSLGKHRLSLCVCVCVRELMCGYVWSVFFSPIHVLCVCVCVRERERRRGGVGQRVCCCIC